MTIIELQTIIQDIPIRSAWDRGVREYAVELIDNLDARHLTDDVPASTCAELRAKLLNGARAGGGRFLRRYCAGRNTSDKGE